MPGCADLACILLAAGEGRRFGGRKLEADLDGKMVGLHMAETLAGVGFGRMIAVSNNDNSHLNAGLLKLGFELLINPLPPAGQAQSVRLGLEAIALDDVAGALIALGDMPFVSNGHLKSLTEAFDKGLGRQIICSEAGGINMPPAIFPRSYWQTLHSTVGDKGGRSLLETAIAVAADSDMLRDVDHPEDISRRN